MSCAPARCRNGWTARPVDAVRLDAAPAQLGHEVALGAPDVEHRPVQEVFAQHRGDRVDVFGER
jgi:hypothetical protein